MDEKKKQLQDDFLSQKRKQKVTRWPNEMSTPLFLVTALLSRIFWKTDQLLFNGHIVAWPSWSVPVLCAPWSVPAEKEKKVMRGGLSNAHIPAWDRLS